MTEALNLMGGSMLFSLFSPILGVLVIWAAETFRSYREWSRYQTELQRMFLQERINRMGG